MHIQKTIKIYETEKFQVQVQVLDQPLCRMTAWRLSQCVPSVTIEKYHYNQSSSQIVAFPFSHVEIKRDADNFSPVRFKCQYISYTVDNPNRISCTKCSLNIYIIISFSVHIYETGVLFWKHKAGRRFYLRPCVGVVAMLIVSSRSLVWREPAGASGTACDQHCYQAYKALSPFRNDWHTTQMSDSRLSYFVAFLF